MDLRKTSGWMLLPALLTALSGCGGHDAEHPNVGPPPPAACPPGQHYAGRACVPDRAPPPAATATTAPVASNTPPPLPTVKGGPSAVRLDAVAARAATELLAPLARQHAPAGARAVGAVIAGQFQQGQSLSETVQMQPGRCYTVVGAGLPPVQNLDIQLAPLVAIPGLSSPVIASDKGNGPSAVVGDKPNCFKWAIPFAAPIKVLVTVSAGQGVAAAQVYEK